MNTVNFSPNSEKLPRDAYKRLKAMDNQTMTAVLRDIYYSGWNDAANTYEDEADRFDSSNFGELYEKISKIKGIGESRMNEIIAVIDEFFSPCDFDEVGDMETTEDEDFED
jgi:cation transport regulator ChaB